jgi:hypothetical protein
VFPVSSSLPVLTAGAAWVVPIVQPAMGQARWKRDTRDR